MLSSRNEPDARNRNIPTLLQGSQREPHIDIRPARKEDFDSIMEIENSCFPGELAYSRRQMRYLLFKANSATLVEEADGQITGYVTALFRKGTEVAGIETIGVAPPHRGKGTGKRLLSAAEKRMLSNGATFSRLEVSAGNKDAINMYRKAGYDISEEIPGYYQFLHHGTRAAYRMEKFLKRQII
jgi:ribosomal protein S18 acetylase RimI-like enzyme